MTKQIRILQIGVHDMVGGVETYIRNYYKHIDREKIQFDFATVFDSMAFENEFLSMGANVYHLKSEKRHPFIYAKQLRHIISQNGYQIVHINMLSAANILPLRICHECGVPIIIAHSHNSGTPSGILRKILHITNQRWIDRYATHYFACSQLAAQWMFGKAFFEQHPVTVIRNAVETEKFSFDPVVRKQYRDALSLNGKFVVGHVGRFMQQKNHFFLIDVFHKIHQKEPNSILLLVGEGELLQSVRNKVNALNLNQSVLFLGTRKDVNALYQAMDVFVFPSIFEGLGIVLMEAQASGLKCLVSDVVPPDTHVTSNLESISLNQSVEFWAEKVLSHKTYARKSEADVLAAAHYDIEFEAKTLQDWYLNSVKQR